jgi:hypothetical protein
MPSLRAKESNPDLRPAKILDRFVAEPVIGRAFRATRWLLAMTLENH